MGRQLGILNVGGHPKDAIMYAGGSMAIHVARGDRVCALTPTNGLHHHQVAAQEYRPGGKVDVGAYVEERRQELIAAAKELGVTDVRFLGHDDEILFIDREIVSEIADVVGEVRPDIVVTHHPHDSYAAHGGTLKKCVNSQAVYPLSETTRAQGPREEIHRLWEREALGAGRSQGRSGTSWRTGFEVRSRS